MTQTTLTLQACEKQFHLPAEGIDRRQVVRGDLGDGQVGEVKEVPAIWPAQAHQTEAAGFFALFAPILPLLHLHLHDDIDDIALKVSEDLLQTAAHQLDASASASPQVLDDEGIGVGLGSADEEPAVVVNAREQVEVVIAEVEEKKSSLNPLSQSPPGGAIALLIP